MGYKHGAYARIDEIGTFKNKKKPGNPFIPTPVPPTEHPEEDEQVVFSLLADGSTRLHGVTFKQESDGSTRLAGILFSVANDQILLKGCV